MPARKTGDLNMADRRAMAVPDRVGIAVNPRRMPEIELQPDLRQADILQDPRRLIEVVQEVTRHILGVQRLDCQCLTGGLRAGPGKVLAQGLFRLGATRDAGHHMDLARPQGRGHIGRAQKSFSKLVLGPRYGGKSALPFGPVAGRCIDQRHRQSGCCPRPFACGMVIGKQDLDPVEPGLGRQPGALERRDFGKQQGQIGGKAGHQVMSAEGMIGKKMPPERRPNQRPSAVSSWVPNSISR